MASGQEAGMTVDVALSIILHPDGRRVLVARRPENAHLAGFWEFPGGKVEEGETTLDCCIREAGEEVGLDVAVTGELPPVAHAYPDRTVCLHPILCQAASPDARPLASQEIRWVNAAELAGIAFPEANRAIVAALIEVLESRI
jgi:8-oxo-dGTP diphosphatase